MSYSNNPLLPRARAQAVRLVVEQGFPITVAARKSGIHRITLWRWYKQWLQLNENVQFMNANRPTRTAARTFSTFKLTSCRWSLPTRSSRPHAPRGIPNPVIERIRYYRQKYGRCAAIVHAYCMREGSIVSLSTVRRVLDRLGLLAKRKWQRKWRPPVRRPQTLQPGDLVQTDTVHLTSRAVRIATRLLTCTLVGPMPRLSQDIAAAVIHRAEAYGGFRFRVVQADNGPEYGQRFEELLKRHGTKLRHSRVRRPNDNAFIERFNRTIQEECVGTTDPFSEELYSKVLTHLAYYNDERLHLGLQCRTPKEMLQRL